MARRCLRRGAASGGAPMMAGAPPAPLGDVVIIGAGVSGLACARAVLRWGCRSLVVLEKAADLGGVWRDSKYPDLSLHTKSFSYSFYDYHLKSSAECASGEEVQAFLERFASASDVQRHIRFGHEVQQVIYHGESGACGCYCEVEARDVAASSAGGGETFRLRADFVVCAVGFSNAGRPSLPALEGLADFAGRVVHSSDCDEELLSEAASRQLRVVMLGAGKSAADILVALKRRGHGASTWLFSKSMWFVSWEHMYAPSTLLWLLRNILLAVWLQVLMLLGECWLERGLRSLVRAAGVLVNPAEPDSTEGLQRCRFATIRRQELAALAGVPRARGRVRRLTRDAVELEDGRLLPADVLVCATGYRRGGFLPALFVPDGLGGLARLDLSAEGGPPLYRAMIPAACPRIAMFAGENMTSQLPLSVSLQAEWFVRFYASGGHLRTAKLRTALEADRKALRRYAWPQPPPSEGLLSGGNPYLDVILPAALRYEQQVLGDLGLPPFPLDGNRSPAAFDAYCGKVARRLAASSAGGARGDAAV